MKKIHGFITRATNHHLQTKFLLTPIAITLHTIELVDIKMVYLFGVRIFRKNIAG